MSNKPKPFPYKAKEFIDKALMSLSDVRRQIMPLLDKQDVETVARAGRALDKINQAVNDLQTAKKFPGE